MLLLPAFASFAQEPEEHLSLDEVRTQSGVDPTRIISKIGFSTWYFDKEAGNAQVNNRISATFGVDDWAFNVRMDLRLDKQRTGPPGLCHRGGQHEGEYPELFLQ